ncbi:MAG: hypothetical protein K8T90_10395, partial [Planctomycetes bacterium]|nr:hypothetical protein [Planctomycetota bacterium]
AREAGLVPSVEATGYLPHRETTAELLAGDLLWLPTITRRDGGPVSNVPAKTYEYLGSGRPVVSLAGPGDVRDALGGRTRCRVVAPGTGSAGALGEVIAAALAGGLPPTDPDPEDARAFRRSETARGVAEALRAAASSDSARITVPAQLDPSTLGGEDADRATP